jgi:hypothetical protein
VFISNCRCRQALQGPHLLLLLPMLPLSLLLLLAIAQTGETRQSRSPFWFA